MELVARDLKAQGLYLARALSFAGVEYEILEHCLTEAQVLVLRSTLLAPKLCGGKRKSGTRPARTTTGSPTEM